MLRRRGYVCESVVQSSMQSDDYRLTNVFKTLPPKMLQNIPYRGQAKVTIYKAEFKSVANPKISSGEMVTLRKTDIPRVFNTNNDMVKVVEREVNAYDVLWAGQDEYLWYYSPIRGMKG